MASSAYDALIHEVQRVTTSPYPSQLRTLRDLALQCSDADIAQWASSNPCAVELLASCLIDGFQQWSYVLDIITRFAFDESCRDALLQHEPTLLHTIVAQAIKNGATKSAHVRASVALLSVPFPDIVALPAGVQTLFVQLVEEAAKKPSTASIEPVYLLLIGTGSLLLAVLDNQTLIQFEEHLINILKSEPGTADLCLSLYCFSIMKVACASVDEELRLTASSYSTQDFLASTPTSSRWKSEAMQQFFTGSKAKRSIQLVVLLVLQGSSQGLGSVSLTEKIRSLILANEVVTAIPADLRKNWCGANATTIRKLQEKACAEGLDETTRTLALRFLGKLCDLDSLPHLVLDGIERTFLEPKSVHLMHTLCPRLDDRELLTSVLARTHISVLLQNAVEYAIRPESSELAAGLNAVARSVHDAKVIIEEQKITSHEICTTLNEPGFAQSLHQLQGLAQTSFNLHAPARVSGWCPQALHRARSDLVHQISDLLLRACHSSATSPHNMTLLLSLHATSARGDRLCAHERVSWRDHVAFGECDGDEMSDTMDWREALRMHFQARASVEQDAITRVFAKACASLEARCEDVERPLRKELERRREVEQHNEDLTKAFSELEARNVNFVIQTRNLELDRDQYLHDLEESRDEHNHLHERITDLEQKLRETQAQSERQLAEMEEAKQMNELDHAASLARRAEELEDMQEQLEQTIRDAAGKEKETSALQKDLSAARLECSRWEECATSKDSQINRLQSSLDSVEKAKEDLDLASARLSDELKSIRNHSAEQAQRLTEMERNLETAQAQHEEMKLTLSHEVEEGIAAQRGLEEQLSQAKQHAQNEQTAKAQLESQLTTFQEKLLETTSRLTSDLEARNSRVVDLKKKISQLQRRCEQKDQQISEAEAMRTNLMAAMGLGGVEHARNNTIPLRSRESLAATQEEATPPTPTSADAMDIEDTQGLSQGGAGHNDNGGSPGPTPKRARPWRSMVGPLTSAKMKSRASMGHVASFATARLPSSGAASGAGTGGKGTQLMLRRQTLGAVSGNAGKGVVFKTPEKGKERGQEQEILGDDESTFDGSELFAGTQGARIAEMQLDGNEEGEGES